MKRVVLLNDTSLESHYGCVKVKDKFVKLFEMLGWDCVGCFPVGCAESLLIDSLSLLDFDLAVVNGEGTIHDGNAYADQLLAVCVELRLQGKSVILLNSSIYTTSSYKLDVLKTSFDLISVRSKFVRSELKKKGIDAIYMPDFSFIFSEGSSRWKGEGGVVYTDSVFNGVSFGLMLESFLCNGEYRPFIYPPHDRSLSVLRYIKRYYATCVSLRDYLVFIWVALYGVLKSSSAESIDSLLLRSSKVITGRFHAVCFCIRLGVPFECVDSNTSKIEDLLSDVKVDHLFSVNNGRRVIAENKLIEYGRLCEEFMAEVCDLEQSLIQRLRGIGKC